jgi:hypothetical protein
MPPKRKKYTARFPPVRLLIESICLLEDHLLQARIKKIMQTDEEVGKVAAAVPVIICILLYDFNCTPISVPFEV